MDSRKICDKIRKVMYFGEILFLDLSRLPPYSGKEWEKCNIIAYAFHAFIHIRDFLTIKCYA